MTIALNHVHVQASDREATARHLTDILGLPPAREWGLFLMIEVSNAVVLSVLKAREPVCSQHYAFLVSEDEFDLILGRLQKSGLPYWADPFHREEGRYNTNDGGRGLYWDSPEGHLLEIITVPYETWPAHLFD